MLRLATFARSGIHGETPAMCETIAATPFSAWFAICSAPYAPNAFPGTKHYASPPAAAAAAWLATEFAMYWALLM